MFYTKLQTVRDEIYFQSNTENRIVQGKYLFVTFIARDGQFRHKVFVKQKSMAEKEDVKVNVKLKETDIHICLKSAIKFSSFPVPVLLLKRDNKIVIKFPRFWIVHRQFERRNVSNQEIMIRIEQLSSTETEGWYLDIWKLWLWK